MDHEKGRVPVFHVWGLPPMWVWGSHEKGEGVTLQPIFTPSFLYFFLRSVVTASGFKSGARRGCPPSGPFLITQAATTWCRGAACQWVKKKGWIFMYQYL